MTKADKTAERKERLAAELRANLKKRKAQSRARQGSGETEPPGGEPATGLAPEKTVR